MRDCRKRPSTVASARIQFFVEKALEKLGNLLLPGIPQPALQTVGGASIPFPFGIGISFTKKQPTRGEKMRAREAKRNRNQPPEIPRMSTKDWAERRAQVPAPSTPQPAQTKQMGKITFPGHESGSALIEYLRANTGLNPLKIEALDGLVAFCSSLNLDVVFEEGSHENAACVRMKVLYTKDKNTGEVAPLFILRISRIENEVVIEESAIPNIHQNPKFKEFFKELLVQTEKPGAGAEKPVERSQAGARRTPSAQTPIPTEPTKSRVPAPLIEGKKIGAFIKGRECPVDDSPHLEIDAWLDAAAEAGIRVTASFDNLGCADISLRFPNDTITYTIGEFRPQQFFDKIRYALEILGVQAPGREEPIKTDAERGEAEAIGLLKEFGWRASDLDHLMFFVNRARREGMAIEMNVVGGGVLIQVEDRTSYAILRTYGVAESIMKVKEAIAKAKRILAMRER